MASRLSHATPCCGHMVSDHEARGCEFDLTEYGTEGAPYTLCSCPKDADDAAESCVNEERERIAQAIDGMYSPFEDPDLSDIWFAARDEAAVIARAGGR